jgi:hypothetical protein
MMGTKQRDFAPLVNVSLEALVPQDHFYRHVERTLDLSFVREFVQQTYACKGRPSIDPVVFFKLQLVMFFFRGELQGHETCSHIPHKALPFVSHWYSYIKALLRPTYAHYEALSIRFISSFFGPDGALFRPAF